MLKYLFARSVFTAALLTLGAAATMNAAADYRVVARIPFAFEFAGTMLPAGDYSFEQLGRANVLTIESVHTRKRTADVVRAMESVAYGESTGQLVFGRKDGRIVLRRVAMPNGLWLEARPAALALK